jgi:hypothetical protein
VLGVGACSERVHAWGGRVVEGRGLAAAPAPCAGCAPRRAVLRSRATRGGCGACKSMCQQLKKGGPRQQATRGLQSTQIQPVYGGGGGAQAVAEAVPVQLGRQRRQGALRESELVRACRQGQGRLNRPAAGASAWDQREEASPGGARLRPAGPHPDALRAGLDRGPRRRRRRRPGRAPCSFVKQLAASTTPSIHDACSRCCRHIFPPAFYHLPTSFPPASCQLPVTSSPNPRPPAATVGRPPALRTPQPRPPQKGLDL